MHTVWKGAISFGLVTIPVKLHAATEDKGIKLRQIHDKCKKPIKQEKVCPICNEDVNSKSLVEGYEYATDRFVVITNDELTGLKSEIEDSWIPSVSRCAFVGFVRAFHLHHGSLYCFPPVSGQKADFHATVFVPSTSVMPLSVNNVSSYASSAPPSRSPPCDSPLPPSSMPNRLSVFFAGH